jgi:hypothetical protein
VYSAPGDVRFKEVEETTNFQLRFPGGVLERLCRLPCGKALPFRGLGAYLFSGGYAAG